MKIREGSGSYGKVIATFEGGRMSGAAAYLLLMWLLKPNPHSTGQ